MESRIFLGELSTRRNFIAGSAKLAGAAMGGSLIAACGSTSQAAGGSSAHAMNLQLDWLKNELYTGSFMADHNGYWKRQGLSVNMLSGGPSVSAEANMAAGKALVAYGTLSFLTRIVAQGSDLKVIASNASRSAINVMSPPNAPISHPSQLRGKTIGAAEVDQSLLTAFLGLHKIPKESVKVVTIQDAALALVNNQADGTIAYLEEPITYELRTGKRPVQMLLADYGDNDLTEQYAVRGQSLKDPTTRALVVKWLRGELLGWKAVFDAPDEAAMLVVNVYGKSLGLDPEVTRRAVRANFALQQNATSLVKGFGWFDDELIKQGQEGVRLAGGNPDLVPAMYTTEILQEVYGGANGLAPIKVPS